MADIIIVVKNFSSVVTDSDVAAAIPAFQIQANRDVAPAYDIADTFALILRGKTDTVSPGEWEILILNSTDDASALGYHQLTANGDPISYVGAKVSIESGDSWTSVFSHELCEMIVDPQIDQTVISHALNREYAKEVCDACESFTYRIGNVEVSDFVLRSFWDDAGSSAGVPLSFCGNLSQPFSLSTGGYLSYIDLANPTKGWQQVYASRASRPGTARGARRRLLHSGAPRLWSSRH